MPLSFKLDNHSIRCKDNPQSIPTHSTPSTTPIVLTLRPNVKIGSSTNAFVGAAGTPQTSGLSFRLTDTPILANATTHTTPNLGPQSGLTFASLLVPAAQSIVTTAAFVERTCPRPVAEIAAGVRRRVEPLTERDECPYVDQFAVAERRVGCLRILDVIYATMFRNVPIGVETDQNGMLVFPPGKTFSPLLGPTGHVERFNVW